MRFHRLICAALSVIALASCGANGPLGLNPQPNGDITITNATTSKTLSTTLANPFVVDDSGGFSIGISENYFSGPYVVKIISWTAPFDIPCFSAATTNSSNKTNIVTFTAVNAAPVSDPTQASPCMSGDEETAAISDNHGHTVNFYYEIYIASSSTAAKRS